MDIESSDPTFDPVALTLESPKTGPAFGTAEDPIILSSAARKRQSAIEHVPSTATPVIGPATGEILRRRTEFDHAVLPTSASATARDDSTSDMILDSSVLRPTKAPTRSSTISTTWDGTKSVMISLTTGFYRTRSPTRSPTRGRSPAPSSSPSAGPSLT